MKGTLAYRRGLWVKDELYQAGLVHKGVVFCSPVQIPYYMGVSAIFPNPVILHSVTVSIAEYKETAAHWCLLVVLDYLLGCFVVITLLGYNQRS